jgi:alpha-1,6-mannosyltransferase
VAKDGPLRADLERRARAQRLSAEFLGHVRDRAHLARPQASADLCLAPGRPAARTPFLRWFVPRARMEG